MPRPSNLTKMPREKLQALISRAEQALNVISTREADVLVKDIRAKAEELGIEITELVDRLRGEGAAQPQRRAAATSGSPATAGSAGSTASSNGRRKKRSNPLKGQKIEPWFKHGDNAWTGRGRPARWLVEYIQGGGKIEDVLVDKTKLDEARKIEAKIGGPKRGGRGRKKKAAGKKRSS